MVLVPVSDDKSSDLFNVVLQIGCIGDHKVNAEHVVFRKCKAAVHHHYAVSILERGDVHADLFQTAKRNDPKGGRRFPVHLVCSFLQSSVSSSEGPYSAFLCNCLLFVFFAGCCGDHIPSFRHVEALPRYAALSKFIFLLIRMVCFSLQFLFAVRLFAEFFLQNFLFLNIFLFVSLPLELFG